MYGDPELSRQYNFDYINIILAMDHFDHGDINLIMAESFSPWQNHFYHGKNYHFHHDNITCTTATSFLSCDSNDVMLARKMLWEPIRHGSE